MQSKTSSRKILRFTSNVILLFFSSCAKLLFLNSCTEQPQAPVAPIQPRMLDVTKKEDVEKQDKKIESENKMTAIKEIYTYNPSGKVDPFVPMISEKIGEEAPKSSDAKKPVQEVPLTPLQKLNVDDFVLVAVISTPKGLCALLEDPAMNGFIVREGMQIGKKAGMIKKIFYNSVLVEEKIDETQENSEKRIMTLTLRKK